MIKPALLLIWAWVLCFYASWAQAAIPSLVNELVLNHWRLIVLSEAATGPQLAEARRAGHYLFVRNQNLRRELVIELNAATVAGVAQRYGEFARAMDGAARVEGDLLALSATFQSLMRAGFVRGVEREDMQRRASVIAGVR